MKLFGFEVTRAKALEPVSGGRGWFPLIRESFAGAWQRNVTVDRGAVSTFHADFACKTLIASDISKLRIKLVERDGDGIWTETDNASFSPVLRKPNGFQTRNQFWECYILSKLGRGNTYVLKERDARNIVVGLYVLDPDRVQPMVADDGSVFYRIDADNLAGVESAVLVPAREIIHDRFNCLFHPLVGIPPVYASGLAAMQGLNIQTNSAALFKNQAMPGGILTAPGTITEPQRDEMAKEWEKRFGGENRGRIAILGGGLSFSKLSMTAVEGQMIEQLKYSAEVVCSTYHVPPYKIGVGALPSFNNVQALNVEYFAQALQALIEAAEECLDDGLGIGAANNSRFGTEFDVENLLRMDSVTQMDVLDKAVKGSIYSPNEARAKLDKKPVEGGASPMAQQQNYSLAALAKRDAQADPFGRPQAVPADTAPLPAAKSADHIDMAAIGQFAAWELKSQLDRLAA